MEITKLSPTLINDFRRKANEKWAVYHIYKDHNGKDLWGLICSAMDWITVAVDGIDISLLSGDNSNEASIKMMTFLSCIDVMWEGVSQLHRVLYDTDKVPLKDDRTVFNDKDKSDNEYFKTIRAIFMAHPVNLSKVYGESDKWFASWSGGQFSSKNFSVILYSNIPGKQSVEFPISYSELMNFANRRYLLLSDFMDKIDKNIIEYNRKWQKIVIPKSDNPVEHIEILIDENEKRWENDSLRNRLEYLYKVFTTEPSIEKNKQIISEYQAALTNEIDEIHNILQNVDYGHELKTLRVQIPSGMEYLYDQLYDSVSAITNIGVTSFRPIVCDLVVLDDCSLMINGICVLIDAALWKKQTNNNT